MDYGRPREIYGDWGVNGLLSSQSLYLRRGFCRLHATKQVRLQRGAKQAGLSQCTNYSADQSLNAGESKTAWQIGVTIPRSALFRADRVIR